MTNIVLCAGARTPIGSFGGSLTSMPVMDLGALVIAETLKRNNVAPDKVDEVVMGCILPAGLGQNPARQSAVKAGIPVEVPSHTINKACGSGIKAVVLAAQAIIAGDAKIVVAGGMESMTNAPYLLEKARYGYRMGNGELVDSMIGDALTDAFNKYHMGITAENLAEKFNISREEQDAFAFASQQKAAAAIKSGAFKEEIVPVTIKGKKGDVIFDADEFPRLDITAEGLAKLRPAFKKDGTVTAGNASGINDGAAAILVTDADTAKAMGMKPLARLLSYASAGVDPAIMGYGPVPASEKALKKAGLTIGDMDLIEANEAFAAQSLSVARGLKWDSAKVNVNGGAIALGHPVGASGTRILLTLLYAMKARGAKKGLATLCIGGGQGIAAVVERM